MKFKKLQVGDKAPHFVTKDVRGQKIDLAHYADKKVLMCFFRYAGCPFCNLALHRLALEQKSLADLGLEVLAFIESTPENVDKYLVDRHPFKINFPLIPDPDGRIYQQYGVDRSYAAVIKTVPKIPEWLRSTLGMSFKQGKIDGSLTRVPAQFMIGPDKLKIQKVNYGTDYMNDVSFIDILEFAQFGDV